MRRLGPRLWGSTAEGERLVCASPRAGVCGDLSQRVSSSNHRALDAEFPVVFCTMASRAARVPSLKRSLRPRSTGDVRSLDAQLFHMALSARHSLGSDLEKMSALGLCVLICNSGT